MKKFDLSFDFKGRRYSAAIRIRQQSGAREFVITALDWQLERLLYGNHIIREVEGTLQADVLAENKEQTELKLIIAGRLSEYLHMPCFVGNQCLLEGRCEESWEELHPILRHERRRQNFSIY